MTTRRPVADLGGYLGAITSPDTIDGVVMPVVYPFTEQGSDPATPSAGTLDVYAKTDHKMYAKDSTGTVTQIGSGGGGTRTFAFFA